MKKASSLIKHAFAFIFLVSLGFIFSWVFYLWINYPPGADDALMHVYRLKTIAQFFPNHTWLHTWAGGMPHFIIYPTIPYLPVSLLQKLTSWTPYFTIFFSGVFAFGLLGFAVYLVTYALTGHFLLSLLAGILVLANFGTWQVLLKAVYARVWAAPFMVASWASFSFFLRRREEHKEATRWLIITAFVLGLTFWLHFFMGVMAATILVFLAVFTRGFSGKNIGSLVKLGLLTFLLAAVTILPIIFLRPPGIWVGKDVSQRLFRIPDVGLYAYWHDPKTIYPGSFSIAFYYLLLLLFALLIFVFLVSKRKVEKFYKRSALGFFLVALGFFLYANFPIQALGSFYNQFLPYFWVLSYLPFFLSFFITLVIWLWLKKRQLVLNLVSMVLIVGTFAAVFLQYRPLGAEKFLRTKGKRQISENPEIEEAAKMKQQLALDEKAFNYRFGDGNYGKISVWFNLLFPFIPQTRDFFFPGIVDPDQYFYIIQAGWFEKDNWQETNYLFDWWGVKKFVVKKNDEDVGDKFIQKPEFYTPKGEAILRNEVAYDIFVFEQATPVMAASNSPAILVVGRQPEVHTTVFRSLAYGDFNSRFAIPVEGKEFVDDYKLEELRKFPVVFLYQSYRWRNFEKASRLLKDYVSQGGRLVIEANRDLEDKARLPEVYPVVKAKKADIEGWQLDGGSWGGMVASELKEGASPLVAQINGPILVEKKIDDGTVIWSGMNLPFHTVYYHGAEESRLMAKILAVEKEGDDELRAKSEAFTANSRGGLIYETSAEKVEFVHPEKRILELKTSARGILFKEAHFPNWKAKVNGKRTKIYKAGSGFMYVPLVDSKAGDEVVFVFGTHWSQWAGRAISFGTLTLLARYLFKPGVFKNVTQSIRKKARKIFSWWDEEEV